MVLIQKMTHPPISFEKSFESSYQRVGTFSFIVAEQSADIKLSLLKLVKIKS